MGLFERFETDPEAVLAGSGARGPGLDREYLFRPRELSFFHAEQSEQPAYYLASAVYAYTFLFADRTALEADPLDPRLRLAANIYNLGLVHGLAARTARASWSSQERVCSPSARWISPSIRRACCGAAFECRASWP